ncbi:MAG: valine--pyruvate aminotransferase [Candidatus Sumerlaeota bacterium]|nr:valine--pyruvate aminotransferase [Candidatus Sumerlaeota bacterium]
MKLSKFGEKLTGNTGICQLMDDLGQALSGPDPMLMLGAGNPAHIQAVQDHFRKVMEDILAKPGEFERIVGNYDGPEGSKEFTSALAELFNREFGWNITHKNICLTNGSQMSFFMLFNLFAGEHPDGSRKKILLPLAPEYIGYADLGITEDFFTASKPEIHHLDDQVFKYMVDFDAVKITDEVGAICASRPTNPTGNVLTENEIVKLSALAKQHDVPLILDNAYGTPFPDIIFADAKPFYNDNTIVCMSLSKLGLPVTRTGIIIANEDIARRVANMNAVISLAPNGMGGAFVGPLVRSGEILKISRDIVKPFYQKKAFAAKDQLCAALGDVDFHIHKPEGALFLWLWFRDFPITSQEFYERLKKRGVLVLPGHYFFPGLKEDWQHKQECIRVTYAGPDDVVRKGLDIIAEEAKKAYAEKHSAISV